MAKHPARWKNNTARRLFVVAVLPLMVVVSPVVVLCAGLPELVGELWGDAKRIWRAPL
ncbi:hypothetical protein [Aeromonas phage 59.1]|nr:hypothetical protein [Aeromonas phage 59.1]